ncbi:MAG: phage integrase family protein [Dorea sp.]|jgi:integrase|nr:phage integrase family protein [Dorea sp.]
MQEDRIYYKDLAFYEKAGEKEKQKSIDKYFDLAKLPTDRMRAEMKRFIIERGTRIMYHSITHENSHFNYLCEFLKQMNLHNVSSFLDKPQKKWIQLLKGWMMQNGMPLTYEGRSVYGTVCVRNTELIRYMKRFLEFLEEEGKEEVVKDVWKLDALGIEIKANPIYNVRTLDFRKIGQPDLREECKKAVYMNLQYEVLGTVQSEMTVMRKFSAYLKKEFPQLQSCREIDRDVLEGFLISLMMAEGSHKANSNYVIALRRLLETIGKIYNYRNLENLFINTDVPPEIEPEFHVYSDEEMKRLNARITELDEQIARCMVIHQMLGTRISDTLTLRTNCLYRENGQDMIEIHQVKTKTYRKPVSKELAELIRRAIEYTAEKYGETEYIFVDEKDQKRPLQYTTVKHKVLKMISKENLLDDEGKLFRFSSHLFRHYYGVKLTEMHLDDWTIARLLGHKGLGSVKHYRKMSNQRMADETREVRQMMTDIIYTILDGWGEEYEQIRQND